MPTPEEILEEMNAYGTGNDLPLPVPPLATMTNPELPLPVPPLATPTQPAPDIFTPQASTPRYTGPNAPAMLAPWTAVQQPTELPMGGTATMTSPTAPAIPQPAPEVRYPAEVGRTATGQPVELAPAQTQQQFEQEQAQALGIQQGSTLRQGITQQQQVNESKANIASRQIIKELRGQGMTDDQIRDATGIGTEEMSRTEAYRRLAKLSQSRTDTSPQAARQQREMERINDRARYGEDDEGNRTAKNQAARFVEINRDAQSTGPDPEMTDSIYDSLTPSQKREYDRYQRHVSDGVARSNEERRINDMIKNEQKKREDDYAKKQEQIKFQREEDAIARAEQRVQSQQARDELNTLKAQVQASNSALERYNELGEIKPKKRTKAEQAEFEELERNMPEIQQRKTDAVNQIIGLNDGAPEFATVEEAEAAGLAPGTVVIIDGRRARITE